MTFYVIKINKTVAFLEIQGFHPIVMIYGTFGTTLTVLFVILFTYLEIGS